LRIRAALKKQFFDLTQNYFSFNIYNLLEEFKKKFD
jgi:hypothetical protein